MDYYHKYLKYRQKYLELKHKQKGGGVIINLDKYKDLFQKCIQLIPNEIGFNLLYDEKTKGLSFEITKGGETGVTIPYSNVINIHTHPISIEMAKTYTYHPPTQYDYIQSCFDYFRGTQMSIVVEKAGIWYFKPNYNLIKEIEKIQPDIRALLSNELIEGETQRKIKATNKFGELYDVIFTNTSNEGVYLNFEGENIRNILSESFINSYNAQFYLKITKFIE